MAVEVIQDGSQNPDLKFASDTQEKGGVPSVVWPLPRSMKIDMATVLQAIFSNYNLDWIPVIVTGSFHPSMMRDKDFKGRPVVVMQRANDTASRESVGELTDIFTATDLQSGKLLDINNVLANIGSDEIIMKEQVSDVIVDIWLFDENDQRAEQLYLLIKTAMFAAEKTFLEVLGYLEFIRISGSDSSILVNAEGGGTFIVFQRNLQYRGRHIDWLAGIEQVVSLISETYTAEAPPEEVSQSVDIGN